MFRPSRIGFWPLFWVCPMLLAAPQVGHADWKQWRGNQQDGVAPEADYPTEWTPEKGVAWQVEVPGRGGSTPIVADGKVYVTSGVDGENRLYCYAADGGEALWDVTLGKERVSQHGKSHRKGSGANPSVVAEDEAVFAYYRSGDLACVSTEGEVRWHINLQDQYGEDTLWWNLGTSPIPTEDALVVAVIQTGPSYLVGVDKETGETKWKVDRITEAPREAAQAYTTPLLLDIDGRSIIAVMGADNLTLHDAKEGTELARLGGFNPQGEQFFRSISSPVAAGNIVICPYARGDTITAVDAKKLLAGAGQDAIVWFRDDLGSDVPTPAATEDQVYVVRDKGVLVCVDAQTGKDLWESELPRSRYNITPSPLVAGDHVYLTREDGTTFVLDRTQEGKIVSTNEAGNGDPYTVASLVPIDGELLERTREHLLRIQGSQPR